MKHHLYLFNHSLGKHNTPKIFIMIGLKNAYTNTHKYDFCICVNFRYDSNHICVYTNNNNDDDDNKKNNFMRKMLHTYSMISCVCVCMCRVFPIHKRDKFNKGF